MKIAIIGAGNVGGALAKSFAKSGYKVVIGARNINSDGIKKLIAANKNIIAKSVKEASAEAEVILVSTPVQAIIEVAEQIITDDSKVIIDATNSVFMKPEPYNNCFEALKDISKSKNIVKCFNSTGFENMANPRYGDISLDMFVAGDNLKAKKTVSELAKVIGFDDCFDFGGEDKVNLLEQFAMCWINLAIMQKQGRDIAFKIIKR